MIYGAAGAIGGAVARAFAAEGAKLFLTGRLRAPVEAVAKDIVSVGGTAEVADIDVLDEQAVDRQLQSVIDQEAMTRDLSAELTPQGIRVVGLRPHGIPETSTMREVFDVKAAGMTFEQFEDYLASTTHPRRVMMLAELANMAAFMASDD